MRRSAVPVPVPVPVASALRAPRPNLACLRSESISFHDLDLTRSPAERGFRLRSRLLMRYRLRLRLRFRLLLLVRYAHRDPTSPVCGQSRSRFTIST